MGDGASLFGLSLPFAVAWMVFGDYELHRAGEWKCGLVEDSEKQADAGSFDASDSEVDSEEVQELSFFAAV